MQRLVEIRGVEADGRPHYALTSDKPFLAGLQEALGKLYEYEAQEARKEVYGDAGEDQRHDGPTL